MAMKYNAGKTGEMEFVSGNIHQKSSKTKIIVDTTDMVQLWWYLLFGMHNYVFLL